jgi:transposase-like protein
VARGLKEVKLIVSDDHEGIKTAVAGELLGVGWQRCVVQVERNVLSHVPASWMAEVAQDLKADSSRSGARRRREPWSKNSSSFTESVSRRRLGSLRL